MTAVRMQRGVFWNVSRVTIEGLGEEYRTDVPSKRAGVICGGISALWPAAQTISADDPLGGARGYELGLEDGFEDSLPAEILLMLRNDLQRAEPQTQEQSFNLTGKDGEPFAFRGELLASVSSHTAHGDRSKRWREISIYRKSGGGYIVYSIGRSLYEGEEDRYAVDVVNDVFEVIALLVPRKQKPRFMVADLLYAAEERDPAFITILDRLRFEDLDDPVGEGEIFLLPRENDRDLRFRGILLAHQSSRIDDAPSWTEIKIFRVAPRMATPDTTRYVIWKAKCHADKEPTYAKVSVAKTGLLALRALIRRGRTWIESVALDAIADAADEDQYFARTLENMLDEKNFRQMLEEVPKISRYQRETLGVLAGGSRLITRQADDDRRTTSEIVGWTGNLEFPLPKWQVFVGLSRQRLIERRLSGEPRNSALGEWGITDLGRRALDVPAES